MKTTKETLADEYDIKSEIEIIDMEKTEEEIKEDLEKYIVISDNSEENMIFLRKDFEEKNMCGCYDDNGQEIGCYDAGCYSFNNSALDCKETFLSEFSNKFPGIFKKFEEELKNCDYIKEIEEILSENRNARLWSTKWNNDNEEHTKVIAGTFHDGSNYKSIILENEFCSSNCVEFDEEESLEIIKEYMSIPYIEKATKTLYSKNFEYRFSLYSDSIAECYVLNR